MSPSGERLYHALGFWSSVPQAAAQAMPMGRAERQLWSSGKGFVVSMSNAR